MGMRTFHRVGGFFVYDDEVLRVEGDGAHYSILSGTGARLGGGAFHRDAEGRIALDTWENEAEPLRAKKQASYHPRP